MVFGGVSSRLAVPPSSTPDQAATASQVAAIRTCPDGHRLYTHWDMPIGICRISLLYGQGGMAYWSVVWPWGYVVLLCCMAMGVCRIALLYGQGGMSYCSVVCRRCGPVVAIPSSQHPSHRAGVSGAKLVLGHMCFFYFEDLHGSGMDLLCWA